jgi:hypothetical protein
MSFNITTGSYSFYLCNISHKERRMNNSLKSITISLFIMLLASGVANAVTLWVTSTADNASPGTLRWAITLANATSGPDTINFGIAGAGPHTIFVLSQLPQLADPTGGTVINGFTQPGAAPGGNPPASAVLMIVLDGTNAGPSHGIWITTAMNEVHGLVIQNFEQDGIRMEASPHVTAGNYIYCNFVGTDVSGSIPQGNGWNQSQFWAGISVIATPSMVGVASDNFIFNNLVSCNYAEGVGISNCPPSDVFFNIVFGNYIGTDITGSIDFGNTHDGVYIGEGAHDNAIDKNLISGNDFEGICIVGYDQLQINTYRNIVIQNIIGLDVNLSPLPNTMDGISIGQYGNIYQGGFANANVIDTNIIAHNGNNGITVWEHASTATNCDTNTITRNSIYNNSGIGIDLNDEGVTSNDGGDPDQGPNEEVNFPVITSAVYNSGSGQTLIQGTLDIDTPPDSAQIEVFHVNADPSGYGEGDSYLGVTMPDAAGNWSISVTGLIAGDYVTATTTDKNFNTSEFCLNCMVQTVGIDEESVTTKRQFKLQQNRPNPFSTNTAITFLLAQPSPVTLKVYDVSGRLVKTLADGNYAASQHTIHWDGKTDGEEAVKSGVYFYKLQTEHFRETRKLTIVE